MTLNVTIDQVKMEDLEGLLTSSLPNFRSKKLEVRSRKLEVRILEVRSKKWEVRSKK